MLTSIGRTSVISHAESEYIATVYIAYPVKSLPCFFSPNRNSGMFRISRNTDRDRYSGVIWSSSIDVPEMPLS